MISVLFVMAHEGGTAVPGDDMAGSLVRWASMDTIDSEALALLAPLDQAWLRRRVLALFRACRGERAAALQQPLAFP